MKIKNINLLHLTKIVVCSLTVFGCAGDDIPEGPKDHYVYMPQATGNRASLQLPRLEDAQDVFFGAAYAGTQLPQSDISVAFESNDDLIAQYNNENGTDYKPLPEDSYEIPSMTTTIPAGNASSDPLRVSIITSRLDATQKYMFPITMVSVSEGILDSSRATAWFRIDAIVVRERDVTNRAAISVSDENSGGASANEGSAKLVDGDYTTKFLTFDYSSNFWMQLAFPTQQVVSAYTLTSGNDAPARDPRNWVLSASNNGEDWTELDVREGEFFAGRNMTRRFDVDNEVAYKFYRIQVTANGGASIFQLSEWRVIEFY